MKKRACSHIRRCVMPLFESFKLQMNFSLFRQSMAKVSRRIKLSRHGRTKFICTEPDKLLYLNYARIIQRQRPNGALQWPLLTARCISTQSAGRASYLNKSLFPGPATGGPQAAAHKRRLRSSGSCAVCRHRITCAADRQMPPRPD